MVGYGVHDTRSNQGVTDITEWLGDDPSEVAERLRVFTRDCEMLSRDSLIKKYDQRWVGVFGGQVQAVAVDLDSLLEELDRIGLRADAAIRFMDSDPPMLILHDGSR